MNRADSTVHTSWHDEELSRRAKKVLPCGRERKGSEKEVGRRGPEGQRARPVASGASSEDAVAESFPKLMKVTTLGIQGNPKVCT